MLKYCRNKWEQNKAILEEELRTRKDINSFEYKDLVRLVVRCILNNGDTTLEWDADRITEIDNGDYQGTLLYLIPVHCYQPSEWDYLMTYVGYGSCSCCDTLQAIQEYGETMLTETQVKEYMSLCKDLICRIIKPYNNGWRYDEEFQEV